MSKLKLDKAYSIYEMLHMPENISKKKKTKVYDEIEDDGKNMLSTSKRESRLDRIERIIVDVQKQMLRMQKDMLKMQKDMRDGFKSINNRLDYIVKANKLKDIKK